MPVSWPSNRDECTLETDSTYSGTLPPHGRRAVGRGVWLVAGLVCYGMQGQPQLSGGVVARVFLSYADRDRKWASQLHEWLVAEGHEVFRDQDPRNGIVVGEEWDERPLQPRVSPACPCSGSPAVNHGHSYHLSWRVIGNYFSLVC
jgi:hypothetical protein